ncbi:hypothetical protein LKM02_28945 [Bacillus cereus]|uniref:hypothetical protein n=2 Tax=Bacillus cereus TaxID=1396 RepID=UPI001D0DE9DE|nr:hypothetical protein [Bacillus cereus]MCC2370339.1 hypothetical protein [Bacillus cereus]MCC2491381.1 hypothetical protein [Bacillus cereus]
MIKKDKIFKIIMSISLIFSLFINVESVFAEGPSIQMLGSKGVTVDNKGISLSLQVADAKDVVTFQLSELMLVNDCSFNFGLTKWVRPSQKENKFDINIKENGTYAFYIFVNGKVKGYVRFKAKGFPQNAQGGGVTQYWGEGAKYYGLPEEAVNPDDFRDQDGANNGICVNEKVPDDKPAGAGDIEEPKDNENNGDKDNNGGGWQPDKDYFKDLANKLDEISSKIPPVPDWDKVSDVFADKIGNKMKDVLGEAPDPPNPPPIPDMPNIDTGGLENQRPEFKDNPELDKAGFTGDDIKKDAPVIKENKDESGGFDIGDPTKGLPEVPKEMPKPGETEKSGWTQDKPKEPNQKEIPNPKETEVPKPSEFPKPKDNNKGDFPKPNVDSGNPPKPNTNEGKPPKPNTDSGNPPKPNTGDGGFPKPNIDGQPPKPDGGGKPPNPSGEGVNMKDYKPSPN